MMHNLTLRFIAWKTVKTKWELALEQANRKALEEVPKLKSFDPKNTNLPILETFTEDIGEDYWTSWVKKPYKAEAAQSWIIPEKLKEEADRLGMKQKLKLEEITKTLEGGANLEN
jgi:hypothetical protein